MTTMVKAFPTLYGKASTGKIKVWKIEVKEKEKNIILHQLMVMKE